MQSLLHNFPEFAEDGAMPFAKLLPGSDGALYGTTRDGGTAGKATVLRG